METKPKIHIRVTGRFPSGDIVCGAFAEDGGYILGHVSSTLTWARHDMGLRGPWKHETYRRLYPDGYELVDELPADDAAVAELFATQS